ncbi:hypothetical protein AB1E33_05405 [Ruegeria sp. 2012CJ15-1]
MRRRGGPRYEFDSAVVDEDGENGGVPGGNIRNAFLYNPDRVEAKEFVTLESDVLAGLGVTNPDAFEGSRDPLLGVFEFNGQEVTLINNHFSSRFGSTPIFGGPQPFVQAGEDERAAQSLALNEVVDGLLASDPDARVTVLGDLNTFEFTDELAEDLPGVGDKKVLTNLITQLEGDEAYSFNFQGNSQALDHIFVTDRLLDGVEVDVVHVNTDFTDFASDHDPVVASFLIEDPNDPGEFLLGGRGKDMIEGTGRSDVIIGFNGRDQLFGQDGNDVIPGGRGRDLIEGGDGHDTLSGGRGRDTILGGDGDDFIFAGPGRDVIEGGAGDDLLNGGRGRNSFVFEGDFGDDILLCFKVGVDEIEFVGTNEVVATETDRGTLLTSAGDAQGSVELLFLYNYEVDLLI